MPQKAGPNINAGNFSKITSVVNSKAPLVPSFSVSNIRYCLRHTLLEIKLHSLCMTRTPFQSLFVYFDDKKSTFRMLLEPLCPGSSTDSRRPFCLGINFLVVSYKPANPHRRARSGSHRLPGKRPPYHHQAWFRSLPAPPNVNNAPGRGRHTSLLHNIESALELVFRMCIYYVLYMYKCKCQAQ